MKKDKETATILTLVPATGAAAELTSATVAKAAEDGPTFVEFVQKLRAYVGQEFARGKDIDQIFDELEESYGRLDKAPSKTKRRHPTNASRIATTPAKIDPVTEKRAKAYRDMEPHVCDLARAAELAMLASDVEELFLFAVEQFETIAQRFRANYYAEEFPA
jgi:hypothetical protein